MTKNKTMSVAEGLRELERIDELFDQRTMEIGKYCSKWKDAKDIITNQKDYVDEQAQSARDLITDYKNIKLAINQSNIDTTFEFNGVTYSVAEAILYKQGIKNLYTRLYNAFHDNTARRQISEQRTGGLTEEHLVKLDLVPQLYYDPKVIQKEKEDLLTLMSHLDSLIDKANHNTEITV